MPSLSTFLKGKTEEEVAQIWAKLTRSEKRRLHALLGSESLNDFIARIAPEELPPPHLQPIVEAFERAKVESVRLCISIPPRHGKAIDVSTPMMTSRGWIQARDIVVGDQLVGSNGKWTRVIGVYPQGTVDLFDVTFSDGSKLTTCPEHIWSVKQRYGGPWRELTTSELAGDLNEADGRKKWRIPQVDPFEGTASCLSIDPYLLGLWLGDGSSYSSLVTTMDRETVEAFNGLGHAAKMTACENSGRARSYYVGNLYRPLKENGLLKGKKGRNGKKHIPESYLLAGVEDRLALLQGLCDTDGTVAKDGSLQSYTTTDADLAVGFRRLVCGLGGKVTCYSRPAARKTAWTFQFRLPHGMNAFRLKRKMERLHAPNAQNAPKRFVASVTPRGRGGAVCFEVDAEDHLYCAGDDFIVTHNTATIRRALAWWFTHRPEDINCYASRNDTSARFHAKKIKAIAEESGVAIQRGSNRSDEWLTTAGGGLVAVGLGGMLTGKGIQGLAVVDDPFKDTVEAGSQVMRDRVKDWFDNVLMTRLEGPASVIVVHTRWHPDDLIGRLMEEGGFEIINNPAIAKEGDELGREEGEALWPERFPLSMLLERKKHNEFGFAALYQGEPVAKGARMFYGDPRYYDPRTTNLNGCTAVIGVDPAASEKTSADYSVGIAMALRGPITAPEVYILDHYRRQVAVPEFSRAMIDFQKWNHGAPLKVEAVAGFKAVPQIMRDLAPGLLLQEVYPVGDKKQRAELFATAWNDGRVFLPMVDPRAPNSGRAPPWVAEYVSELKNFTGSAKGKDDQVDASSHAYNSVVDLKTVQRARGAVADPYRYA